MLNRSKSDKTTSARTSGAVGIFLGALLIAVMVIGLVASRNPGAFIRKYRYDFAWESFVSFCQNWWIPAGVIGIPTFLFSLIRALILESREKN
jgi:hypothetical protein